MCEIADWIIGAMLLMCAVCDSRKKRIPVILLIGISVAVVVFVLCFKRTMPWARVFGGLLGVVFFLVSRYTKEAVGYGDSWLILLLGVYLGRYEALQVLLLAAIGAAVYALFCLWRHRWKREVTIPFAPFLAAAYVGVLFL